MITAKDRLLKDYPAALADDSAAVFIGAGISMGAGYPSWTKLLKEIGEELGVDSSDVHDLAALAQWSVQETGSATRVRNVIKEQIGVDRTIPVALEVIARLPMRHIWTTNYDRLIERAFNMTGRPIDAVAGAKDLSLRARSGATRLYKMHGSVDRLDDIVISTDDYELYKSRRGAYLPLLQAHLTSMSMLFLGLSFTDPNIRHVLSLIRESFTEAPPEHFAILRPPHEDDFSTAAEFEARTAQHRLWTKDLRRYGLVAVEIDDYAQVPNILREIEQRISQRRIWISGSWPIDVPGKRGGEIFSLSEQLGKAIGGLGYSLVTGGGLLVSPAAIGGFLDSLRAAGVWEIDRRLITRPFPQPILGRTVKPEEWTALRKELAHLAGIAIFVGGHKTDAGTGVVASGVLEEAQLSQNAGVFLLPIAATGWAAEDIANRLIGSAMPPIGPQAARPTDEELRALADKSASVSDLVERVISILNRLRANT